VQKIIDHGQWFSSGDEPGYAEDVAHETSEVSSSRQQGNPAGSGCSVSAPGEAAAGGERDEVAEIWSLLTPMFLASRDRFFQVIGDLGLTPPHGHAVMMLAGGSAKMRDLATQMSCDASYVTNVVDRLEELGLAKRQESAGDRRVREVVLTPQGEQAAKRVEAAMRQPPDALRLLSARDSAAFLRILRKLGPPPDGPLWARRKPT
jgi:DNA-binding MarR family transcriptional regulator